MVKFQNLFRSARLTFVVEVEEEIERREEHK